MDGSILHDADHIISFIHEVGRKEDIKAGEKPSFNWINVFSSFDDIISVLKNELRLSNNLSIQLAEQTVKYALESNLVNEYSV